jgi:hypothetical protein
MTATEAEVAAPLADTDLIETREAILLTGNTTTGTKEAEITIVMTTIQDEEAEIAIRYGKNQTKQKKPTLKFQRDDLEPGQVEYDQPDFPTNFVMLRGLSQHTTSETVSFVLMPRFYRTNL